MAQRFVIDININGAQGAATQGRAGQDTGIGAAAVGAFAGSRAKIPKENWKAASIAEDRLNKTLRERNLSNLEVIGDPYYASRTKQGVFSSEYEAGAYVVPKIGEVQQTQMKRITGIKMFAGSRVDEFLQEHQKQLKTLGIAAAWKATNTVIDLKNYKSGDSYSNQQRSNVMKMATYSATIIGTGFNPVVITGIVGNELISGISDYQKYTFDRKMESQQIFNIKQIAGDVSYGINRRGGY